VGVKTPLISIVIPTWNRPTLVSRLVQQINMFDHEDDLEIIVVDNNSNFDNWILLEKELSAHQNIRLYRNTANIGMTPNWNKAIEYAHGQWIGLMCDDDSFKSDSIRRIREFIKIIAKPCLILQNSSIVSETEWVESGLGAARKVALPPASGQFWHREMTKKLGAFNEKIKYCPDAEFWLRLAFHYPVLLVRDFFVSPHQHDTNYLWEAFRSQDFLEQVKLSITLSSKWLLDEKTSDSKSLQYLIDDGMWETLRTVLNNTFLKYGKMQNFLKYFYEFIKYSILLDRKLLMIKVILNLPFLRVKEIIKTIVSFDN
jgi:glycosyltransferase involved in cell wall biosynthesis